MGQVPDAHVSLNAPVPAAPDESWIRWAFFSELWGWALLMHQATFDRWPHSVVGWALCGCGGALVLWPGRLPILAVAALVDLSFVVQGLPETANHLLFEGLVCFTWLCALAWHAFGALRRGVALKEVLRPRAGESHPLEGSLRPLRWGLLLLYWLSVLHKLNYDFLDPDVSCASYMYRRVSALLPFLPRARWAEYPAIWGTLLAEAAVPALLLHPRTWRLGLVAALLFHLLLGFDPTPGIYSFTGLLYALFILVLPGSFVSAARSELAALQARVGRKPLLYVRIGWLAVWTGILLYGAPREDRWSFRVGFPFFVVWALVIGGAYLFTLYRMPKPSVERPLAPTPALLWILPLLVMLNGLNPYLGLRTQLSFSMFSNLRTEGGRTNHLFMPRLATLAPYEDDLVEVLDTDDEALGLLKKDQLLIPYFEFRRMLSETENVHVTYVRQGQQHDYSCVKGVCSDPELATRYSALLGRLFFFRPVDKGPKMHCRH